MKKKIKKNNKKRKYNGYMELIKKKKKVKKWKTIVNVHLEMKLINGLEMKSNPKNETGNEKPN